MKSLDSSLWNYWHSHLVVFSIKYFPLELSWYFSISQYNITYPSIGFYPYSNTRTHSSFYISSWGRSNIWQGASLLFPENLLKHAAITHSAALINDVPESSWSITHHHVICSLTSITAWPTGLHHLDILYALQGGDIQLQAGAREVVE